MAKAIMRMRKLKRGALAGVGAHLGRLRHTPNADPSRAKLNRHAGTPAGELGADIDRRLKAIEEQRGRKTRRDAVVAVEVLCTASPEWFQEHGGQGNHQQLADRALQWARQEFGADNVVSADLHMDEQSPHVHLVVFPKTSDGRLSAKEVMGDRERLSGLQDSYAAAVAPLGLERGQKGSKARHQTIRQYYAQVNDHEAKRQAHADLVSRKARIRAKREQMAPKGPAKRR